MYVSTRKIPLKQCISCQEMKSKKEMIGVIETTEDGIVLDAIGRRNGRGARLCSPVECLRRAVKGKGSDRSFEMPIPKEIHETLGKEMEEPGKWQRAAKLVWPCKKGKESGQRRIFDGEICKERKAANGDCIGGSFG